MNTKTVFTESVDETHALGRRIGELCEEGTVILLDGDLGAGKTTLTQGIAKGLDVKRNVTSPTFTIQKIYKGRLPLYHIDAYRLEGMSQDLGFDEYMDADGVTVIEWADFVPDLIPDDHLLIHITLLEEESRCFQLFARGERYEKMLEELA